jgi:ketosteroid isomerase-like protein
MISSTTSPIDVARRLYDAIDAGDLAAAVPLLADDVVLHVPGTHALSGDHHGLAGFAHFVSASAASAGGTEVVEVLDVLGGTDHAAVYCRVTATRPGREPLENMTVHLLRVADGRVVEAWLHNRDEAAVDAFWS